MVLPDMSSRFVESALQSEFCNILTSNAGMEQPDYFNFHCQLTKVLLTRQINMCCRWHETIFRRTNRVCVTLLYSLSALPHFSNNWAIKDQRLNHIVQTMKRLLNLRLHIAWVGQMTFPGAELCTKKLVSSYTWKHFNIMTTSIIW